MPLMELLIPQATEEYVWQVYSNGRYVDYLLCSEAAVMDRQLEINGSRTASFPLHIIFIVQT